MYFIFCIYGSIFNFLQLTVSVLTHTLSKVQSRFWLTSLILTYTDMYVSSNKLTSQIRTKRWKKEALMLLPELNYLGLHLNDLHDASSPWHFQMLYLPFSNRCSLTRKKKKKKALILGNIKFWRQPQAVGRAMIISTSRLHSTPLTMQKFGLTKVLHIHLRKNSFLSSF